MLNKEKIVKAEIFDANGNVVISTDIFEFPKDFFSFSAKEFVVLKGDCKIPANKGDKVEAIFYYRNGNRIKYETTLDLATDFQVNIHLGKDYTLLEERRRFFKTCTNITGKVLMYTRDEETSEFNPELNVNILNINIGGIFMSADFEFKPGDKFLLSFLDGKVKPMAQVLRLQPVGDTEKVGFGCKFETLTASEEETVSRFIFDCQLQERERLKKLGY